MFKRRLRANIDKIDEEIGSLLETLSEKDSADTDYSALMERLEGLSKVRDTLEGNLHKGVSVKPELISGAIGLVAVMVILKYEETDVITSKAYGIATKMFRG